MYELSKIDTKRKNELIRKGFELAEDALKLNDQDAGIYKLMVVLMDAKGELDGHRARVMQIETIKNHLIRAIEIDPEDAESRVLLGNLEYGLADMPWYKRKIISSILATPPTGNFM